MGSGGARNRSGPQVDPKSGRSDARGLKFTALPREGYKGDAPKFPLPGATARELEKWADAWKTPQAAAWAEEPWRWQTVALYVRVAVRVEDPEAPAALLGHVHRFADQIGLTPAGLKENGWAISADEIKAKRTEKTAAAETTQAARPRRLRAVSG